jgi:hypothetical protein
MQNNIKNVFFKTTTKTLNKNFNKAFIKTLQKVLLVFVFSCFLIASVSPVSAANEKFGAIWQPQKNIQWQGVSATVSESNSSASSSSVSAAVDKEKDEAPVWIGYVKRNKNDWFFRLRLSNGTSETIRRGGATTDGWALVDFMAQANRPQSITLERAGVKKTLILMQEFDVNEKKENKK